MVFTDIEGSTALLRRLGPEYVDVLDNQRAILRKAWSAHFGTEIGTEGDSFFVVFSSAEGAVNAAVQAQQDLAGHAWPRAEQVRVRVGIHTGRPMIHDGGYVGMDVHRAARIASSAHGGQVVLSAPTRTLVAKHLNPDFALRDLGDHNLKDLPAPERLFQVKIPGLPVDFPPLKSLGATSSLPKPPGRLVGRDDDLATLHELLCGDHLSDDGRVRLLTLTGPGGSGKTRLAIALATRLTERAGQFPDGAFFVPLVEATTADAMLAAIGEVLDVPRANRTRPKLLAHLCGRRMLMILDNLEQVEGADKLVHELHQNVPHAVVIATSRRRLRLTAEHEFAVSPLQVADGDDAHAVAESAAAELFVQVAGRVRPGFAVTEDNAPAVASICRHLDGLPLALELAAARTKLLSPRAIVARLDAPLDLSGHVQGVPRRHQTLRETIDWSYQLLSGEQQLLFRRLGVFAGGADLSAVHAVAPDLPTDVFDVISELVDASLVRCSETRGGEPRFWLLETIRAFALDASKNAHEHGDVGEHHARHYAAFAEMMEPLLRGPRYMEGFDQLTLEHDNLRAALAWSADGDADARDSRGDPPAVIGLRIIKAMQAFSRRSGHFAEETSWIEQLLSSMSGIESVLVCRCQSMLSGHYISSDPTAGRELARTSVEMSRRLGDRSELIDALDALVQFDLEVGRMDDAQTMIDEIMKLVREAHDPRASHRAILLQVQIEVARGDYESALQHLERAYALVDSDRNPIDSLSADHERAWILRRMGRAAEALHWIEAATEVAVNLNFAWQNGINFLGEDYAGILAELGDAPGAARLMGAVDGRREALAFPRTPSGDEDIRDSLDKARTALSQQDWNEHYQAGRAMQLEDALVSARTWQSGAMPAGGQG